jgi:hypothetical protein
VDAEYRPFLTSLCSTNAFERFTESLYTSSMSFFLCAVKSLPPVATDKKEKEVVNKNG